MKTRNRPFDQDGLPVKRCENCKAEILFEDAQFCEHCGVTLVPEKAAPPSDNDDFEVTEAHDDAAPGRLRGTATGADDLGVQSSAEVVQDLSLTDEESAQISQSTSPVPITGAASGPGDTSPDGVKRLSAEEVKSIEKNLYRTSNYLTEDEKRKLLSAVNNRGSRPEAAGQGLTKPVAPIDQSTGPDAQRTNVSRKGRGVAYYVRNYIQIKGNVELHDND